MIHLKQVAITESIFFHYYLNPKEMPSTEICYRGIGCYGRDVELLRVPGLDELSQNVDPKLAVARALNAIGGSIVADGDEYIIGQVLGQCVLFSVRCGFASSINFSPNNEGFSQVLGSTTGRLFGGSDWNRILTTDPIPVTILPILSSFPLPIHPPSVEGSSAVISVEYTIRGRVELKISFAYEGSLRWFPALFDTGSSNLRIGSVYDDSRNSFFSRIPTHDHYEFHGQTPIQNSAEKCHYGTFECISSHNIIREIRDTVFIDPARKLAIGNERIMLTEPSRKEIVFGASAESNLAHSFKLFGLVPPNAPLGTGQLVIGHEVYGPKLVMYCHGGVTLVRATLFRDWWMVNGELKVGADVASKVLWVLDTGSPDLDVPMAVHDSIVSVIERHRGFSVRRDANHHRSTIFADNGARPISPEEAAELIESGNLPDIEYTVGAPELKVVVSPSEYVRGPKLLVSRGSLIKELPQVTILGLPIIRKFITIFDHEHSRIGFCPITRFNYDEFNRMIQETHTS